MIDISTGAPLVLVTSALTISGQAFVGWLRNRIDMRKITSDADARIEEHRDSLTFQLLKAAKDEVAAARAEVAMFRPLAQHLAHFDEALSHIERLVLASDPRELETAQKAALGFLGRMKGQGNAQQLSVSAAALYQGFTGEDQPC